MSINITKQPLEYNLAVGKNLWTLSGATQSNQLYLSGVVINGLTASILESPKNPSGVAHLDISRILKTKLAPELIETIDTFANATSMILDYRLNYGSKIGLTQSFTTLSDTKYVLNGYKPENIIDWDYTPYIPFSVVYDTCDVLDRIRFSTKFKALTNYPRQSQDIQSNEYHTTTIFNVIQQSDEVAQNDLINIAPSFVKWTFYDENNTILKEHIESINLTTGAGPFDTECSLGAQSTLERILHIPTGTQNLIDAGIYPSGLTASLVKRYKVGIWTRDTCQNCPPDFNGFILKVNTGLTSSLSSDANSIRLPLIGTNYFVDWGDGNVEYNLTQTAIPNTPSLTTNHTYATGGTYSIKIGGGLNRIIYNASTSRDVGKLTEIEQWGNINWNNFATAFQGCGRLSLTATDTPNLSNVSSLNSIFNLGNTHIGTFNNSISNWDVSNVTNMNGAFAFFPSFNQPLNNWDVSNVTSMSNLFGGCISFNQPLNNWNTSNVTFMSGMFRNCASFNQPLNNWNTSSVTSMSSMFENATSFNQSINDWDVSNVIAMGYMFRNATSFNQNLNDWDTSNVLYMDRMFLGATSFNGDINNWNVSKVIAFDEMFKDASSFNKPLNNWNTSNVEFMEWVFQNATSFNQDLDNWDLTKVRTIRGIFAGATNFNGNVTTWNTSNVKLMDNAFAATNVFNQDISGWDTSKATSMSGIFWIASAFNQDISSWNVNKSTNFTNIFRDATSFNQDLGNWSLREAGTNLTSAFNNSGLSTENYSRTLIGWANYAYTNGGQPSGIILGASGLSFNSTNYGGSPYDNAVDARNYLVSIGWTITGDTKV